MSNESHNNDEPGLPDLGARLAELASSAASALRKIGLDRDGSLGANLTSGAARASELLSSAQAQFLADVERLREMSANPANLDDLVRRMQDDMLEMMRDVNTGPVEGSGSGSFFTEVFGSAFGEKLSESLSELFPGGAFPEGLLGRSAPREKVEDVLSDLARLRISYEALELTGPLTHEQARLIATTAEEGLTQAAIMLARVRTVRRQLDLDAPVVTVEVEISGDAASMTAGMLALVGFSAGVVEGIGKVRAKVELG